MNRLRTVLRLILTLASRLDAESVTTFQSMYYVLFTAVSTALIFVPDANVQFVGQTLSHHFYGAWLALSLVCPSLTLIGRWLTTIAAKREPGAPNPAYGAAWLQLCGDLGVWGNVLIYCASMILVGSWLKELYAFAFILMGVLGGGMFTARSIRRLIQIRRYDQIAKDEGWPLT
jgi:hypothetical protein